MYKHKHYEIRLQSGTWQIREMCGEWQLFLSDDILSILNDRKIDIRQFEDEIRLTAAAEMAYYTQRLTELRRIFGNAYFKTVIKELTEFGDALKEAVQPQQKPKLTVIKSVDIEE